MVYGVGAGVSPSGEDGTGMHILASTMLDSANIQCSLPLCSVYGSSIQMRIATLFPSTEVYETQIWLPDDEPDSVPEQQKTKQGKVEANQRRDQGT